jgi:regulator of sirC expression with transglutaminase-like and TPR domain
VTQELVTELQRALDAPGEELAPAALLLARLEYPHLDPEPWLRQIAGFGAQATVRLEGLPDTRERVLALNSFMFGSLGFAGNREQYVDPRNSFLNDVIERRIGIPITLSVVYLDVGRRAGLPLAGVGFPGHFLVRCEMPRDRGREESGPLVIDPFNGGALLSEQDCVKLLRDHAGEDAIWHPSLLGATDRRHIIVRMLHNLKRAYVALRSFEHARWVADLLVALEPESITELRDRGLLSYHLEDFSAALRDLERYLQLVPRGSDGPAAAPADGPPDPDHEAELSDEELETRREFEAIWEHVKNLRRRVASFN